MMESKTLLTCIHDGLAWGMDAACQKLEVGKVYEVQYSPKDRKIIWQQVDAELPILGACMPHVPQGKTNQLLGRFKVQ